MTTETNTTTKSNQQDSAHWSDQDYTVFSTLDTKLRKFEAAMKNKRDDVEKSAAEFTEKAKARREQAKEAIDKIGTGAKESGENLKMAARQALDRFKASMSDAEDAWKGSNHDVQ